VPAKGTHCHIHQRLVHGLYSLLATCRHHMKAMTLCWSGLKKLHHRQSGRQNGDLRSTASVSIMCARSADDAQQQTGLTSVTMQGGSKQTPMNSTTFGCLIADMMLTCMPQCSESHHSKWHQPMGARYSLCMPSSVFINSGHLLMHTHKGMLMRPARTSASLCNALVSPVQIPMCPPHAPES
jgi:hypothetical protein